MRRDDQLVAVGVQEDNGDVTSMMCAKTKNDGAAKTLTDDVKKALVSGDADQGKTYADLFPTIAQMATQIYLPGIDIK